MLRRNATVVLLATLALTATPAYGASPSPRPTPKVSIPPAAEIAEKEVQRQQKALTAESAILAQASRRATATLQAYQQAQRDAELATQTAISESVRSTSAERRTDAARRQLRGYAGSLYRTGMVDSSLLILTDALSATEPQQLFGGLGLVKRVGTTRANALMNLAEAQSEQAYAAQAAEASSVAADAATTKAAAAKAEAAKVVATYTAQVAARRVALAQSTSVLQYARLRENNLEKAYSVARERGWVPEAALTGAKADREVTCVGADVSGYPNGEIPREAMCPLWGVRGHRLRADAAAAFNAMSKEYAAQTGAPICVTDSYRGFDAQVAVAIEKPDLAATPGQSNHGWGLAADLCDGVQTFGSPAHEWLVENSMQFGWFHPPWAEANGSKPEAWHWEYAGL
jgi:hypothetical protein